MGRKKVCYFTKNKIKEIDYKDVELLKRFINANGKIILCRLNRRTEQFRLPEPGLETKLSAKICFCLKYFLLSSAMALLRARMSLRY